MGGGHVREALRNVLTGALLWSPTLEQPLDKYESVTAAPKASLQNGSFNYERGYQQTDAQKPDAE